MKFSEVVKRVIDLATPINEYWERELRKRHPKYPLVDPAVPDPPPPPQEEELRQFLRSLPAEEVHKLVEIYHLGRGDFNAADFPGAVRRGAKSGPVPDHLIEEMASGSLNEFFVNGVHELRLAGVDVDAPAPAAA